MRIAILSDIHSNHIALEACIQHMGMQSIDGVVLLGDYVSDCPFPNKTIKQLMWIKETYPCWFIRGNREEYFIDYADKKISNWNYSSYKGSLLYTFEHLNQETIDWFRSLDSSKEVIIEGAEKFTIAHGSPGSAKELLDAGRENTKKCLENITTSVLLCGHTHRQGTFQYGSKKLINPGSVGVAIGVKKMAHYAIIEWKLGGWQEEYHSVPYDFEKLKKEFYCSSLMEKGKVWPLAILKSIETGVNYGPLCAKYAYDLAVEYKEKILDRIVPEKYWEMAAMHYQIIHDLSELHHE